MRLNNQDNILSNQVQILTDYPSFNPPQYAGILSDLYDILFDDDPMKQQCDRYKSELENALKTLAQKIKRYNETLNPETYGTKLERITASENLKDMLLKVETHIDNIFIKCDQYLSEKKKGELNKERVRLAEIGNNVAKLEKIPVESPQYMRT